ncbi:MAG: serine hydrolase [Bacillota bacterium]|nr:serine hydrolase [Bacillota bacterium]
MSVVIEDLVDGRRWERDGDSVCAAASTIKVPVMIAAFRLKDAGRLNHAALVRVAWSSAAGGSGVVKELHDGVELSVLDLITLMIIISDNTATNAVLDMVGFEDATSAAQSVGATSTVIRRKLLGGPFYERPDYSLAIDNVTSASDMVAIARSIHVGTAASPGSCKEMLGILLRQQVNDRLPLRLPQGARVAHKTDEFQTTRHDIGVVYPTGNTHPYAIAMLTKDLKDVITASCQLADASRAILSRAGRRVPPLARPGTRPCTACGLRSPRTRCPAVS